VTRVRKGKLQKPRRIVVAMSGGVDSSVAAAILKREGHDVIGITLQLYDHGEAVGAKGSCCAGQDIHDARRVAEAVGVPHYVLDYESRFAATVMDSFAESYVAGETPIPCVTCNQQIKFRDLLATATDLGADSLATGHYVLKRDGAQGPELARAIDAERDQSYFLFATTKEQLARLTFPIGSMPKAEVRGLARELSLPVADKPDSQDICFVPTGRYTDVIERLKPGALQPGEIVHVDGRRMGRHDGIINYTVGQRKGLKIATGEALYVVELRADRNEVVVGPRDYLHTRGVIQPGVKSLGDGTLEGAAGEGLDIYARVRSSQRPRPATLIARPGAPVRVQLHDGEDGISAGQACVFYSDGGGDARILGGGFIARTLKDAEAQAAAGVETSRVAAR